MTLVLPTIVTSPEFTRTPGWFLLALGWMGALVFQFGWFANPLLLLALWRAAFVDRPGTWTSLGIGVPMLLCAGDALLWTEVPNDNGYNAIVAYQAGYWLWLGVMALAGVGTVARPFLARVDPPDR